MFSSLGNSSTDPNASAKVAAGITAYRSEMDTVAGFIEKLC